MKKTARLQKKQTPKSGMILKTPIWFLLSLFLFLSMVLAYFDSDNSRLVASNKDDIEMVGLKQGVLIQKDFVGNIVDEDGMPLEDVVVSIGDKFMTTDVNGKFVISKAHVKVRQAFVIAEKAGYTEGLRTVLPTDGTNAIRIKMVKENIVATVISGIASKTGLSH